MGELIVLTELRADRARPAGSVRPAFFFDVACPFSYLAAERVERVLGEVRWIPASSAVLRGDQRWPHPQLVRAHAERRALALRLPLVWPDRFPADAPCALRAAAHAAELGAGGRFALAAGRLAFCGGFDLEDPETLIEAAAAAGLQLQGALEAATDVSRDAALNATARELLALGVRRLPAIGVGRRWFEGERALADAAALLRARARLSGPLAPAS